MIPKKLHYIWLGCNKTDLIKKCIDSFHRFMSDYEIIEWNESNIDLNWFDETELLFYNTQYQRKKFAFCSDLARLHILKRFGGIYVDADVEFIKHMPNEFLDRPIIARINPNNTVCNGCMWGCEKDDELVTHMIQLFSSQLKTSARYHNKKWIFNTILKDFFDSVDDLHTNFKINELHGYRVYPSEYFCPMNSNTGQINITDNTVSIHHFNLSWKR